MTGTTIHDRRGGGASVDLLLTKTRVRHLNVLIGPRPTRPLTWIGVDTEGITNSEAKEAHLKRNFRFAVIHSLGGNMCVKKVAAFNWAGERLEIGPMLPCQYRALESPRVDIRQIRKH